jgi:hypothetical protein
MQMHVYYTIILAYIFFFPTLEKTQKISHLNKGKPKIYTNQVD